MKFNLLLFSLFILSSSVFAQNKFENLDVFELQYARDPQVSPDGSKIVYIRTKMDIMKDGKSSSLWIMNSDGTNHQKLTSLLKNETNPRWSPDGKRISFISNSGDGNGSEIFIYWIDSKQYSSISQLDGSPRSLNWSPDGNNIGFLMFVPEKVLQLVSPPRKPKNAKWAEKPRITDRLKHEADGSGYMREGFSHIFYISSEGGKPTQVTKENYNHRAFDWKSDSKGVVFTSNYNIDWQYDYRNSELYTINIDGSSLRTLTDRNGPDRGAAVSPDGKRIAYLGYDDKVQTYQTSRLYIMDIDGDNKREIKTDLDRSITSIKWSSDNKGLYFMYDNEGNTKVAYCSLNDAEPLDEVEVRDLDGLGRPHAEYHRYSKKITF